MIVEHRSALLATARMPLAFALHAAAIESLAEFKRDLAELMQRVLVGDVECFVTVEDARRYMNVEGSNEPSRIP